jgi:tetratricopeptide (TPR) repeat protein
MWIAAIPLFLLWQSPPPYEQGLKALDEKQYAQAVELFSRAIAANPKDFESHFNLGLTYSLLGDDGKAIAEYQKTLELKPRLYQAELNLGISMLRTKQGADALAILNDAAVQRPKEYRPNFYLAEALRAAGQPERARAYYRTALEITPQAAAAEYGAGQVELSAGKLAEAAPHLRKAAELDDANYRVGLLDLAALYEQQKQPQPAIEIYRQFPGNANADTRLGELLLQSDKPEEAVPFLLEAVRRSPTTANRAALAAAYVKSKQPEKALPPVEAILQAEPDNYDVRMLRGRILRDARKFPAAADDFFKATQLRPEAVEAWSELANILVVSENYPAALGALDKIAALHAEKAGHVYLRAIVFDKNRQIKPALENYRRFLAMSNGVSPNEEFKARQRARILEAEIHRR